MTNKDQHTLTRFFSNPLVGLLGSVASIISLVFAFYVYDDQKEIPLLTYSVNPVKTIVVQSNQASKLSVAYDNQAIDTDITAAQVAIWNEGKRSIKNTNVLKPIVVYTENNTPILEATIRKTSRDVVQMSIDTKEQQNGIVTISWNILEHNDGAAIQLIYAGPTSIGINVDGVVEGQKQIENQPVSNPQLHPPLNKSENRTKGFILLFASIVLAFGVIRLAIHTKYHGSFNWYLDWIVVAIPLGILIMSLYYIFGPRYPGPPFEF